MAFENLQLEHGNFTIDRTGAFFYTMDHTETKLVQKNAAGVTIATYFLNQSILEVQSLKYDGFFFWSLERQGSSGFRVRKWEIGEDDLVRVVTEFSYSSSAIDVYDTWAMAVEYYQDALGNSIGPGQSSFPVSDGSVIRIGDRIIVGPSDSVGFEGVFNTVNVVNKVGNTVTVAPALSAAFSANIPIYFTRNFYIFSDKATGGLTGALYKFRATDGFTLGFTVSNLFNKVRAAVFFKNHLMFVRAGEIIWLDVESQNIARSQAIDNLNQARGEHLECFDLAGFSNTLYRLEQQHVFLSGSTYQVENWAPLFNYNTNSVVSEVYFLAVKATPPLVHRSALGVPLAETQSIITVQVLDQFRVPVFNRLVSFASNGGSLSPPSATTDLEGRVKSVYTATTLIGEVTITATVT